MTEGEMIDLRNASYNAQQEIKAICEDQGHMRYFAGLNPERCLCGHSEVLIDAILKYEREYRRIREWFCAVAPLVEQQDPPISYRLRKDWAEHLLKVHEAVTLLLNLQKGEAKRDARPR